MLPDVWGIVLAGGEGSRLLPLTRHITGEDRPKQFCPLTGSRTLLGETLDRIGALIAPERTLVVGSRAHAAYIERELSTGVPHTLLQPASRGTGPGVLWPVRRVARRAPEAVVAVFPSDHFIGGARAFLTYVRRAVEIVRTEPDLVVLLGVEPDGPDGSYGWIEPARPLPAAPDCFRVRTFWEKPDAVRARIFFDSGFLWNSFVIVARAATLAALGRRCLPDVDACLAGIDAAAGGAADETRAAERAFAAMREANFSEEVLARAADSLAVLPVRGVRWSDWGTPERVVKTPLEINAAPRWLPAWEARMGGTSRV
ncbi:MAG TPA: sugar phosphate nucleotidyltransferase [Thermodesulfobacteriota bacterium]